MVVVVVRTPREPTQIESADDFFDYDKYQARVLARAKKGACESARVRLSSLPREASGVGDF
jgi:hypothetical protein